MAITTAIKRIFYPLYIYPRVSRAKRRELQNVFDAYLQQKHNGVLDELRQLRLFSNLNEDGIILKLLASINTKKGYFLDIGSNDCINSNCANLAFNFDWNGVFIDADKKLLQLGKRMYKLFGHNHDLKFVNRFVSGENIDGLIRECISNTEVDLMSIDIDGNDYAIWEAIECIQPKIVIVENKIEYGRYEIIVPATAEFLSTEHGASIVSFCRLGERKGYKLVAVNDAGFNAFYMRKDWFEKSALPALPVAQVLQDKEIAKCFYPPQIMHDLQKRLGDK